MRVFGPHLEVFDTTEVDEAEEFDHSLGGLVDFVPERIDKS